MSKNRVDYSETFGPPEPFQGDIWYNIDDHKLYTYDEEEWATTEERIIRKYNKDGYWKSPTCRMCPSEGTYNGGINTQHWCEILGCQLYDKACTKYDWTKFILENL